MRAVGRSEKTSMRTSSRPACAAIGSRGVSRIASATASPATAALAPTGGAGAAVRFPRRLLGLVRCLRRPPHLTLVGQLVREPPQQGVLEREWVSPRQRADGQSTVNLGKHAAAVWL